MVAATTILDINMGKIAFDESSRVFSSVIGTKMFGDNDKKKKNNKGKGGGGGYDGPRDNSGMDPHRMRLTNFKYNEYGKKALQAPQLAKLKRLNALLADLYEDGIILDFYPLQGYTSVYVACQNGTDCFIALEHLNGMPTWSGPSTSGAKYRTLFRDSNKGKVIGSMDDLSIDDLREKLWETSTTTPDKLERMWGSVKKGLGVAKWLGKRVRDYFDESPIPY